MNVVSVSENTVVVLFEQKISQQAAAQVLKLKQLIDAELADYVIDIVPSYASIHLSLNLRKINHQGFVDKLETLTDIVLSAAEDDTLDSQQKLIEIPVYYGEEVGLDLYEMTESTGLSIEQIIQMHHQKTYRVFALGFSPGFAFLGSVDQPIAMPRKETPRLAVPKGSLGIAGEQTAIYPLDSPGGWNIIGRTPINLVDYNQHPPCEFEVGDSISFTPINKQTYLDLGGEL